MARRRTANCGRRQARVAPAAALTLALLAGASRPTRADAPPVAPVQPVDGAPLAQVPGPPMPPPSTAVAPSPTPAPPMNGLVPEPMAEPAWPDPAESAFVPASPAPPVPREEHVYDKWWFWTVVGAIAITTAVILTASAGPSQPSTDLGNRHAF